MADYPVIEPDLPDPLIAASENAVRALRSAQPLIALPPRRVDLERCAAELERALRDRSGT